MKFLHLSKILAGVIFATAFSIGMQFIDATAIPSTNETQFQLKVGQTFSMESHGIMIKFLNVTSDSRCPSDVTCIWQGEAKVLVNIIENDQDRGNFNLSTLAGHDRIVFGNYAMHLIQVSPFVSSVKKISISDYVISLKVSSAYVESPLKQFKSGIAAKDVKCGVNFSLVIKSEDGSPACVKPDTASKLVERGWAKEIGTSNSSVVNSSCGGITVPLPNFRNMTYPILLMNTNSTSCVKSIYTVVAHYYNNETQGGGMPGWSRTENFSIQIGDLHYETSGDGFGVSSGKDFTNSFKIVTLPETVDLSNYPVGSNFTVTYIIRPLPNATGFYDQSIEMPPCLRYPLAVGYSADQVNSSDFSKGLVTMMNHSCVVGQVQLRAVEASGINYMAMKLP